MAKITKIKASDTPREKTPEKKPSAATKATKKPQESTPKEKPAKVKETKTSKKTEKAPKKAKRSNYFKEAWQEIRQVRWPSRKATWKMFLAVIVYSALFIVVIMLLDIFFEWLFSLFLG